MLRMLSQYYMHFLSQKATKRQAIADLLAENLRSNSATSSKNYQMKRLKYIRLKLTPQFGKCTSTEHLEPFHAWEWWPGLESYSFLSKTMSCHAHSLLPNLAPTILRSTT